MSARIVLVLDSTSRRNEENAQAFCDDAEETYLVTSETRSRWAGNQWVMIPESQIPTEILFALVHGNELGSWKELEIKTGKAVFFSGERKRKVGWVERGINEGEGTITTEEAVALLEWAEGKVFKAPALIYGHDVSWRYEYFLEISERLLLMTEDNQKELQRIIGMKDTKGDYETVCALSIQEQEIFSKIKLLFGDMLRQFDRKDCLTGGKHYGELYQSIRRGLRQLTEGKLLLP